MEEILMIQEGVLTALKSVEDFKTRKKEGGKWDLGVLQSVL